MESAITSCNNTHNEEMDIPQDLSVKSSRRPQIVFDSHYTMKKPVNICNDIIENNRETSTSLCGNSIEIKRETIVNLFHGTNVKRENAIYLYENTVENDEDIAINLCYDISKRNTVIDTFDSDIAKKALLVCADYKKSDIVVDLCEGSVRKKETAVICDVKDGLENENDTAECKEETAVEMPFRNNGETPAHAGTAGNKGGSNLLEVVTENGKKSAQDISKKLVKKLKIKRENGVVKIEKEDDATEYDDIHEYIKKEPEEHHIDMVEDIQKYLSIEIKEEPSDSVQQSTSANTSPPESFVNLKTSVKGDMPIDDNDNGDDDDNSDDDGNSGGDDVGGDSEEDNETDSQKQDNSSNSPIIPEEEEEENLIVSKEPTNVDPLITVEKKPGKKKAKKVKDASQIRIAIDCVMSRKLTVYAAAKYFGFSKSTLCRYISNFKNSGVVPGNQPRFPCEHCSKSFHSEHNLQSHMEVHAADCKYQCDYCEKRFAAKNYLSMHLVKHTETPRYICESCGRCFRRKSDLNQHSLLHSGVKSHKCEACGKLFLRKSDLYTHSKIHTGVKNHKCELCGKCFRRKGDLFSHSQVHGTITNFRCEFCGKYFATNANLTKHAIIHTGIREHKCEICGKLFVRKFHLTTHLKSHIRRLKMSLSLTSDENLVTPPFTFT